MRRLDEVRRRLAVLFERGRYERELEDEMRAHIEMQAEESRAEGMAAGEAYAAARRRFGNVTRLREESGDVWIWRQAETLARDARFGLRVLRKSPGFTAVVVLTLALGIGANSAVFSLMNGVLLRPLPFPAPERLALVWEETSRFGLRDSPVALGDFMDWRARNRVFEEMGAVDRASYQLSGGGEPVEVRGAIVTAGLWRALGVQPLLGRTFPEAHDRPGAEKAVVLSHALWQERFGGSPDVVGRTLRANDESWTIAGVMPAGFRFPEAETALWTNAGAAYTAQDYAGRGRHDWMAVARLKPGVTLEQANEDIKLIAERLRAEHPRTNAKIGAFVAPMREHFAGPVLKLYGILLGTSAFILLIACGNVAHLLMSRAASRRREFATRAALGASRAHLVRQLLIESLVLAGLGGGLGLLLAAQSFRFLKELVPQSAGLYAHVSLDWRVLAFTLLAVSATAFLAGLMPALGGSKQDLNQAVKEAAAGPLGGRRAGWRSALGAGEVALAMILLSGAGLLIRSFAEVRGIDAGFETSNLLAVRTPLRWPKYKDLVKRNTYYEQALERVEALPGVISAGYTTGVPLVFKGYISSVLTEARASRDEWGQTRFRIATPNYLKTLGVPLRRGRLIEDGDRENAPAAAVVNEAMARKFWPGEEAVGKRFRQSKEGPWITVVGVMGDVRQAGLETDPQPELYRPYRQERNLASGLLVRTSGDPLALAAAVRRAVWSVDPEMPVTGVASMEQILDREMRDRRIQMLLLGAFAALALTLASLGVYGVLAYLVSLETKEIGIRMALGARMGDILRGVARRAVVMAALGTVLGVAAALALSRLMAHMLFGVKPTDAATYAGVALAGLGVSLAASFVPARRAVRVDPVRALREE